MGREFLTNEQLEAIVKVLDENLRDHFQRSQQRLEKRKDEDYDEGLEETLVDEVTNYDKPKSKIIIYTIILMF